MFKTFILTLLLLLNCLSVCFADTPKAPEAFLEKSIPWIYVDSSNGIDTYIQIKRYIQKGKQYRVGPDETGEIDVLYDYKSESKAVLSAFYFNYLSNTYHETIITRPVIKYNGTQTKRIGFDNNPNPKEAPIPKGSLIEKIANKSRTVAPKLIERCLAGTYMPKTSDGSIVTGGKDLRVIRLDDGSSFKILFFPGDNEVLSGIMDGKMNYSSVDYAVHESRRDGSLVDGASLWVYVSMGDTRIDNYVGKNPHYDIYGLSIRGGNGKLYYEIKREKEGTMPSQRDYSSDGQLTWVGNS